MPGLRWVELSARASPEGQQNGRRRAGASSALWTGGAGKKEALVSQAGCIPALCAHLSGQELGCRRSRQARPPERAAAPAAPAPSPELPDEGWRRSRPSLPFGPGLPSLPYPSRLPDRVPLPLWVAGRLLKTQFLGSEPSWAGPAASTAIESCTSLSVSAADGSSPKLTLNRPRVPLLFNNEPAEVLQIPVLFSSSLTC